MNKKNRWRKTADVWQQKDSEHKLMNENTQMNENNIWTKHTYIDNNHIWMKNIDKKKKKKKKKTYDEENNIWTIKKG